MSPVIAPILRSGSRAWTVDNCYREDLAPNDASGRPRSNNRSAEEIAAIWQTASVWLQNEAGCASWASCRVYDIIKTLETRRIDARRPSAISGKLISIACYADDFPTLEHLGDAVITLLQDAAGTRLGNTATLARDDSMPSTSCQATRCTVANWFADRYR